jgi:hypothetical protein
LCLGRVARALFNKAKGAQGPILLASGEAKHRGVVIHLQVVAAAHILGGSLDERQVPPRHVGDLAKDARELLDEFGSGAS